jgi:two-component system chemotaxis response regulator CheY
METVRELERMGQIILEKREDKEKKEKNEKKEGIITGKEKILLADDAAFMRKMVKDILTDNGYAHDDIIEAPDGAEAIAQFKKHKPALTLMDIVMPNCDGIEAVKKIKEIDGGAKTVMLSAMGNAAYITDSLLAGAVDFITKPFNENKLLETVKKHLSENAEIDTDEVRLWIDENPDALEKHPGEKFPQAEIDALVSRVTKPQ